MCTNIAVSCIAFMGMAIIWAKEDRMDWSYVGGMALCLETLMGAIMEADAITMDMDSKEENGTGFIPVPSFFHFY